MVYIKKEGAEIKTAKNYLKIFRNKIVNTPSKSREIQKLLN